MEQLTGTSMITIFASVTFGHGLWISILVTMPNSNVDMLILMLEWRGAVSVMQRSPAVTWGDCASFTPQTQTHRQLPRISQWRWIFQDLHGTSSRRWVQLTCEPSLALIPSSWSETSLPWYCWFAISKNFLSIFVLALGVLRWQSHCCSGLATLPSVGAVP